jgi:hypothetical protein
MLALQEVASETPEGTTLMDETHGTTEDSSQAFYDDIDRSNRESEKVFRPIVQAIVNAVPELRESYEEHLKDHDGESLSYIYLPDAVRDLEKRFVPGGGLTIETIRRLCSAIEMAVETDNLDARDLIGLALLDEIEDSRMWSVMRSEFGPRTRQLLLEGWGWIPPQYPDRKAPR